GPVLPHRADHQAEAPEREAGVLHQPHLRRLRQHDAQPRALCLRERVRHQARDRAAARRRSRAQLRRRERCGGGAVAVVGTVPVGRWPERALGRPHVGMQRAQLLRRHAPVVDRAAEGCRQPAGVRPPRSGNGALVRDGRRRRAAARVRRDRAHARDRAEPGARDCGCATYGTGGRALAAAHRGCIRAPSGRNRRRTDTGSFSSSCCWDRRGQCPEPLSAHLIPGGPSMLRYPRIAVSLAAIALITSNALAAPTLPGINARWDNCYADGGVMNKAFACDRNTGSELIVLSAQLETEMADISGMEIRISLKPAAPTLPAWWLFRTNGLTDDGCRPTALSFIASPVLDPGTCVDWGQGQQMGGIGRYRIDDIGPGTAVIVIASAVAPSNLAHFDPGTEYVVGALRINHANTVGTGSCAGCNTPVC